MVVQLVERAEELVLRALFPAENMDIADENYVGRAELLMRVRHAVQLDAVDHLVHDPFARGVHDANAAVVVGQVASDGVHEMRLSHSHAAIDEQAVVTPRRRSRHRPGCCMRKLITRSYYEGLK